MTAGVTLKWQPLNKTSDYFVAKCEGGGEIPKVLYGNQNLRFVGKLPGT